MKQAVAKYFSLLLKDELCDILAFFDVPVGKTAKKAELVQKVTDCMVDDPVAWLDKMSEMDLHVLREVSRTETGQLIIDNPEFPMLLESLHLMFQTEIDGKTCTIVELCPELKAIVGQFIDEVIDMKEADGSFRLERIFLGYLNLYGVLTLGDFAELMCDAFESDGSGYQMAMRMASNLLVGELRCVYKDEIWFVSPFVDDYAYFIDGRENFEEIEHYRKFTPDEAEMAGLGMPYCLIGAATPEGTALVQMLFDLGLDENAVREELHNIFLNSQYMMENDTAECIFDVVNSRMDDIDSFAGYRRCIDIMAAYTNSLPKWLLRGHSSEDVGMLKLSIKVDDDSQMPEEEDVPMVGENGEVFQNAPTFEGPVTDFFVNGLTIRHVAPDAPCPCGSGLSYRNCHGKHFS